MTTGRKRLPDHIKVLKGTQRKDRQAGEGIQSTEPLIPPLFMTKAALPYFECLRDELNRVGLNSRTYSMVVGITAMRMLEIDECNRLIERDGQTLQGENLLRLNPSVRQRNDASRHLQSLLAEIGLTASAGARIATKVKPRGPSGGFDNL